MDKINAMTICHIGAEFVVIAGLSFWLNRRISNLEEKIDIQTETINKYEAMINQQHEMLLRHDQILRQMMGIPHSSGRGDELNQQPRSKQDPAKPNNPQKINQSNQSLGLDQQRQQTRAFFKEDPQSYSIEESDISDTELDQLIGNDELSILKGLERETKNNTKDCIEITCGDECNLKNQDTKINVKKRRRGKEKKVRKTIV
jgi:uncharacterized coiled-coil protein SlyX